MCKPFHFGVFVWLVSTKEVLVFFDLELIRALACRFALYLEKSNNNKNNNNNNKNKRGGGGLVTYWILWPHMGTLFTTSLILAQNGGSHGHVFATFKNSIFEQTNQKSSENC